MTGMGTLLCCSLDFTFMYIDSLFFGWAWVLCVSRINLHPLYYILLVFGLVEISLVLDTNNVLAVHPTGLLSLCPLTARFWISCRVQRVGVVLQPVVWWLGMARAHDSLMDDCLLYYAHRSCGLSTLGCGRVDHCLHIGVRCSVMRCSLFSVWALWRLHNQPACTRPSNGA